MLKFEINSYIWSRTENSRYYSIFHKGYLEAFSFHCSVNTSLSRYKKITFFNRCAIFYKL